MTTALISALVAGENPTPGESAAQAESVCAAGSSAADAHHAALTCVGLVDQIPSDWGLLKDPVRKPRLTGLPLAS